ncbi:MAG: hypothetical protein ACK41E_10595 [Deinococcales bacterium]
MKSNIWLCGFVLWSALAAPIPKLEPRVHFVHGWEGGDPVTLFYEIPQELVPKTGFGAQAGSSALEIKSVTVAGLPIQGWNIVNSFGKSEIGLNVKFKAGLDSHFSSLKVNGVNVGVAPTRVLYLKPEPTYPLSFEKLEQQPNERLFLAMRIFNDSSQTITIEKVLFAPQNVSSGKILLSPKYDSEFFRNLEKWVSGQTKSYPAGSSMQDANKLGLKILPSRGFSVAIVDQSIRYSCQTRKRVRDPSKRYDTFISQPIVVYRIENSKPKFFPIPDQIIADICP